MFKRNRCGLILKSNWAPVVWWRKLNQRVRFWLNMNGWFPKYFEPFRVTTIKYGRMKWENITPEMHLEWRIANWKRGTGFRYYSSEKQEKEMDDLTKKILEEIRREEKRDAEEKVS